jgi:drug/metabolite transporter (DMT)-like permease
MTPLPDPNRDLLISYITLRRLVGVLGMALPVLLLFGSMIIGDCDGPQRSISYCYHTRVGNLFVGLLCAICLFLFIYKGRRPIDGILANVAGILGSLVALIPCELQETPDGSCIVARGITPSHLQGTVHNIIAGLFLLTLAYFSIAIFTRVDKPLPPNTRKPTRNVIYRICGWIMVACVILCALVIKFEPEGIMKLKPIFFLETAALWAFGFSWLVKGETLWRDR